MELDAVDEYKQQEHRLSLTSTPQDKSHHDYFPPWFVKPVANQFWLPEQLGGGSSLSRNPSMRVASTNDLVLDLVVVYILNRIVFFVASTDIVPHLANGTLNGTVTPEGHVEPEPEPAAPPNLSSGTAAIHLIKIFVYAISVFVPIWTNWYRTAVLLNRFEASDMVNYGIFFFNIVFMLFVGRSIQQYGTTDDSDVSFNFLYALVVLETWQVVWCLYLVYHNPKHARALTGLIFNLIVTSMLFLCAAITAQPELSTFFYWSALFSDFAPHFLRAGSARIDKCCQKTMCCCTEKMFPESIDTWPPINAPLLVERLELFLILCLGESVAGADPRGDLSNNAANISQVLLGIAFVCCLKFIMIDFGEHPSQKKMSKMEPHHALNKSRCRGVCWVIMQAPMGLGTLFSAAAIHSALEEEAEAEEKGAYLEGTGLTRLRRWAFAMGVFCVTLASTVAQALHKGKPGGGSRRCKKETRTLLRLAICLMVLILPILPWPTFSDQIWFLFCMVLLLVIMLAGDRYGRSSMEVKHRTAMQHQLDHNLLPKGNAQKEAH